MGKMKAYFMETQNELEELGIYLSPAEAMQIVGKAMQGSPGATPRQLALKIKHNPIGKRMWIAGKRAK
jgi:hypothetical protein